MYRAKLGNIPFVFYDQDDRRWRGEAQSGRGAARRGRQGNFVLHYQPQLDLRTGEILAVEALIRWPHETLGLVPPLKFLPLAEDAGLMQELTSVGAGGVVGPVRRVA